MGFVMKPWWIELLDRLPGWPSERLSVTLLLTALIGTLLMMARDNPALWDVEVFKVVVQATVLTGALNMVLAFHFAANKADEVKTENTGKAFDAITAAAKKRTNPEDGVEQAVDDVVDAAADMADEIKDEAYGPTDRDTDRSTP